MSVYETIEVPSNDGIAAFDGYYQDYPTTGRYPFLIGDDEDLKSFQQMIAPPADGGADFIAQAAGLDVQDWFAARGAKKPRALAKDFPPQTGLATLTDLATGGLKPRVHVGLIEIERPEHLFARLGFGGWNDCPAPHVHVALHRYWQTKYRSIPVALSADVVECFVPNPPTTTPDILTLAAEQHAYCPDIVEQGFGSKAKLAASLAGANVWYFWWD